jgi:ribosomal protein S18 acetylase RimI-like enzyme
MNDPKIQIKVRNDLPFDQLFALYESVGWYAYTNEQRRSELQKAVFNSTYVVSAWYGGTLIGLARGLSDDSSIFFLQDILVRPDFQRQGVGKQLLMNCLERFKHVRSRVLLTDDEGKQFHFYKSLGFKNTKDLGNSQVNTFVLFERMD